MLLHLLSQLDSYAFDDCSLLMQLEWIKVPIWNLGSLFMLRVSLLLSFTPNDFIDIHIFAPRFARIERFAIKSIILSLAQKYIMVDLLSNWYFDY